MQIGAQGIHLSTVEEAFRFAGALIKSGLAPKDFKTQEAVLIAIQMGAEIGLPPMAALQNIAVINGRPAVYGDALKGIVDGSGLLAEYTDEVQPTFARVTVTRKGRNPLVRVFSEADAKKAGLWGKAGPWTQYPQRMLLMRARSWALRDAFPDVLKGVISREEAEDIPPEPRNVTPPRPEQTLAALDAPKAAEPEAPPASEVPNDEPPLGSDDPQVLADIAASKERAST